MYCHFHLFEHISHVLLIFVYILFLFCFPISILFITFAM